MNQERTSDCPNPESEEEPDSDEIDCFLQHWQQHYLLDYDFCKVVSVPMILMHRI